MLASAGTHGMGAGATWGKERKEARRPQERRRVQEWRGGEGIAHTLGKSAGGVGLSAEEIAGLWRTALPGKDN